MDLFLLLTLAIQIILCYTYSETELLAYYIIIHKWFSKINMYILRSAFIVKS